MYDRSSQSWVGNGSCAWRPIRARKSFIFIRESANVPAKDFWSFTLYDYWTRGMLQTDQKFSSVDSKGKGLKQNPDGSYDVYFSPKALRGQHYNWIQTVPVRGWNVILRLFGPHESCFDHKWIPGDPELAKKSVSFLLLIDNNMESVIPKYA